jgi:hypothetical protein
MTKVRPAEAASASLWERDEAGSALEQAADLL